MTEAPIQQGAFGADKAQNVPCLATRTSLAGVDGIRTHRSWQGPGSRATSSRLFLDRPPRQRSRSTGAIVPVDAAPCWIQPAIRASLYVNRCPPQPGQYPITARPEAVPYANLSHSTQCTACASVRSGASHLPMSRSMTDSGTRAGRGATRRRAGPRPQVITSRAYAPGPIGPSWI